MEEMAVSVKIPSGTGTVDVFVMHNETKISEVAKYTYIDSQTATRIQLLEGKVVELTEEVYKMKKVINEKTAVNKEDVKNNNALECNLEGNKTDSYLKF